MTEPCELESDAVDIEDYIKWLEKQIEILQKPLSALKAELEELYEKHNRNPAIWKKNQQEVLDDFMDDLNQIWKRRGL
jgi:prefoldin subunit 5